MLVLLPIYSFAQNIQSIDVTTSINCFGDAECVTVTFNNLNGDEWLHVTRDDGSILGIVDLFSSPEFDSNQDTLYFCFANNAGNETGTFTLTIKNSFNPQSSSIFSTQHTTEEWPQETTVSDPAIDFTSILDCNGDSDGSITVLADGVAPLTFNWSSSNGSPITQFDFGQLSTIEDLSAGTYNLEIIDGNSCVNQSFSHTINEPTPITSDFSEIPQQCFNTDDGTLSVINVAGGNGGPYTYLWGDNQTTSSITVGAGNYSVEVFDNSDSICSQIFSTSVNEVPELEIISVNTIDALCAGGEGLATANITGGLGDLIYNWPNGSSNQDNASLVEGSYTLTFTDDNNCPSNTFPFTINEPNEITVNELSNNSVSCFGDSDGQFIYNVTGGTPSYTSVITSLDGSLPAITTANHNQNNISINTLVAGDYVITVQDAVGCPLQAPFSFTIGSPNEILITNLDVSPTSCYNTIDGSSVVEVDNGLGNYAFEWFDENQNSISTDPDSITDLAGGDYFVQVENIANNCPSDFIPFNIGQPDPISLDGAISFENISCFGENDGAITSVSLDGGTPPYNYVWTSSTGQTFNEETPDSLFASTFDLNVSDANNCPIVLVGSVNIIEPNEITLTNNSIFTPPSCSNTNDGAIFIEAQGGVGPYTYTTTRIEDNVLYVGQVLSGLISGSYLITVTDANPNPCTFDTVIVFNNPSQLTLSTSQTDVSCFGENDGEIVYTASGGFQPYTLVFEDGTQNGVIIANGNIIQDTLSNLIAGIYNVSVIDDNNCEILSTVEVFQPNELTLSNTVNPPSCNTLDNSPNLTDDGEIVISPSGGSGVYQLIYDIDTISLVQGIQYSINDLSPNQYAFELIDDTGCSINFIEEVQAPPAIDVFYTDVNDVSINGASDGSIDITAINGNGGLTYSWLGPNSFQSFDEDIDNLESGTYTLIVQDNNQCIDTSSVVVNQAGCNISIVPNVQEALCSYSNAEVNFSVSGGIGPYSVDFIGDQDGDGFNDIILNDFPVVSTLQNSITLNVPSVYDLIVTDNAGCVETYNFILDQPEPISIVSELNNVSCFGLSDGEILISPDSISGGSGNYLINWNGTPSPGLSQFNLPVGTYVLTIEDAINECSEVFSFDIEQPEDIILADTILVHPTCQSGLNSTDSNGEITLIASGGNATNPSNYDYYFLDPNVLDGQTAGGLLPGTYFVDIFDQTGCSNSQPIEIELDFPEIISIESPSIINPISCFDACDGGFEVITNNTNGEIFNWYSFSDLSTSVSNVNPVTGLCEGTYQYEITNDDNCFYQSSLGIINNQILSLDNPQQFEIEIFTNVTSLPNGSCAGVASVTPSGGQGPYSYEWNNGPLLVSSDVIASSLCANTLYTLTVTDNQGCISYGNVDIPADTCAFDIGTPQVDQPLCNGDVTGALLFNSAFSGGTAPFNVKLYSGNTLIDEEFVDSHLEVVYNALNSGNYNLIVQDVGGCLSTFGFTIDNPDPISFQAEVLNGSCFDNFSPEVHMNIFGGTPPYDIDFAGYELYYSTVNDLPGQETYIPGLAVVDGSYTFIIEDANDCITSDLPNEIFSVVIDDPTEIQVNITTTSSQCFNDSSATASITALYGGAGNYEINWYNLANNGIPLNGVNTTLQALSEIETGSYFVEITDGLGCIDTTNFTIEEKEDFIIVPTIESPSCPEDEDGYVLLDVSGSNGGFNYLWSPTGVQSNLATNLASGTYNVLITDPLCSKEIEIIVPETPAMELAFDVTQISCNGDDDGQLSINVQNGEPQYVYQWFIDGGAISNILGGNAQTIVDLVPATYSVEVTDNAGCKDTLTTTLIEPEELTLSSSIINPTCFGYNDASIEVTIEGGTLPYEYSWLDQNNLELSTFEILNNISAGDYDLLFEDGNGCQLDQEFNVLNPDDINLTTNSTDLLCYNIPTGSATFEVQAGVNIINTYWIQALSISDFDTLSFIYTPEIDELAVGNYLLTVEDEDGCLQTSAFEIVNLGQELTIEAFPFASNCLNESGASAQVNSNGVPPVTYTWSINQNDITSIFDTNEVSNLDPGVIQVNGVDANGCYLGEIDVVIPASDNPLIQVEINQTSFNNCNGQNVADLQTIISYSDNTFIDENNVTFQWYKDGVAIPTSSNGTFQNLTDVGPGTYLVEVTDLVLGCVNQDSITLTDPSPIEISINNKQDVDCFGDDSGSVDILVSNATGQIIYNWSNEMGVSIANDISSPDNLLAGIYNLTIVDINNCEQQTTFEILQTDSIALNLSADIISCYGDSTGNVYSNVTGGQAGTGTYSWRNSFDEIIAVTPNLTSDEIDVYAGMYYLTYVDSLSCEMQDSILVEQLDQLEVTAEIIDVKCFGGSTGSIELSASGGSGQYLYEWEDFSNTTNIVITLTAGIYEATIFDTNNCTLTSSFEVEQADQITAVESGNFFGCQNGEAMVTMSGGTPPYSYFWDEYPNITSNIISGLTPGYYPYQVFDENLCLYQDSVFIPQPDSLVTVSSITNQVLCNGGSTAQININIVNDLHPPYSYSINNTNSFNTAASPDGQFVVDSLSIGLYTIFVKDDQDCITNVGQFEITEPDELELVVETSAVICFGNEDGLIEVEAIGGTSPYDISVSSTVIQNSLGIENINISEGIYDLTLVDANGCSIVEQLSIESPDSLYFEINSVSDFNGYSLSCFDSNDGSISISSFGGVGEYAIYYGTDTVYEVGSDFQINQLSAQNYSISLIDENQCSYTFDTLLTAASAITITVDSISDYNGYNVSCFGLSDAYVNLIPNGGVGTFDFSSNNGLFYEASNLSQYAFDELESGLYTLLVKDENECTATIEVDIQSPVELSSNLSQNSTITCINDSSASVVAEVIGGVSPYNYILTNSTQQFDQNSPENSISFENLTSGNYTLNITDGNGCSTDIFNNSTIVIEDGAAITIDFSASLPTCYSFEDAQISIDNVFGGTAPFLIQLSNSDGQVYPQELVLDFNTPTQFNDLYSSEYYIIIQDDLGCVTYDSIVLTEPQPLSLINNLTNITCYGLSDGKLSMNISGGTSPYMATIAGQSIDGTGELLLDELPSGEFLLNVMDANDCLISDSVIVTEPEELILSIDTEDIVCYGESTGVMNSSVSGGTSPYFYQLSTLEGLILSNDSSYDNLMSGEYIFTIIDDNNCASQQLFNLSQSVEIVVNAEVGNESCLGFNDGTVEISVSNTQGNFELFWSSDLQGLSLNSLSPGDYQFTVIDEEDCFIVDTISILPAQNLEYDITTNPSSCEYTSDGSVQIDIINNLSAIATITDQNGVSYQQEFSEMSSFDNLFADNYTLVLNYSDNCVIESTIDLASISDYNCIIPEPSFSPNFDGVNDEFSPLTNYDQEIEMFVFNRWGNTLYNEKSINPKWDGKDLNGAIAPSADYYYILKFNNPEFKDITGVITLIK